MQYLTIAIQVFGWLIDNKDNLKVFVETAEKLFPAAAGSEKASAVREAIGNALGIEAQIESAWPLIAPFFNRMVKSIKGPSTEVKSMT